MKSNILLVMSKVNSGENEKIFNLGIAYISSYLKNKKFNIFNINLNFCEDIESALKENIIKYNINIIMLGGLSAQYSLIKELLDISHAIKPELIKIVGGGLISGDPVVAMHALEIADYGVIGEGEYTAAELCFALENKTDVSEIQGIVYKKDNEFIVTQSRDDILDLDSLPFPDYKGFEFDKHISINNIGNNLTKQLNAIYIIGSRSCPYNCTFCFHTCGKKYRQRSLDNIFEEVKYLHELYNIKFLGLQDELFSYNKERVLEFCERIKQYNIGWWSQFRVDMVDYDVIKAIKESNCNFMAFGLESANNKILKSMEKKITIEQIEKTLQTVYELEMPFVGSFIFGDKEETIDTAEDTLEWWKKNKNYNIFLSIITPYPGSKLYKFAVSNGIIKDPVKYLKDGCPHVNMSKLAKVEFGNLVEKISSLPYEYGSVYTEYTYENQTLIAKCQKCNAINVYDEFSFVGTKLLVCNHCGQKHCVKINSDVIEKLNNKIEEFLKFGKVAVWAINVSIKNLLNESIVFKNENIFFIDISKIIQNSYIHDKKVCGPEVLIDEDIKTVIIGIPRLYSIVSSEIKRNYKNVENIINFDDLVSTD